MTPSRSAQTTTGATSAIDHDGRGVVKPTPTEVMEDTGSGLDYGVRPDRMPGLLTPTDRFYVRSHAPTPRIDAATWTLRVEGSGVREPVTYSYDDLWHRFPHVSVARTIECAGNRRVLFGEQVGRPFAGTQWGRGAIGTAEWTGVRLRDLLEPAGITPKAREVMPEGLDEIRARRPLPLDKAWADDTVVALAMNGEVLPPDHGFPARLVVSGWLGAASIKWLGRIEVSEEPLYVPWNTVDYVLIGPDFPAEGPAQGPVITELPVVSLVELPWPARLRAGVRGREPGGAGRVPHRRRPLAGRRDRISDDIGGVGALAVPLGAGTGRARAPGPRHRRPGQHATGVLHLERTGVPADFGAGTPRARRTSPLGEDHE